MPRPRPRKMWWVQGFVPEEDIAFKKVVADYEKASGNTIDLSIIPFAPGRQKIVSAMTSGVVPDMFYATIRPRSSRSTPGTTSWSMSATSSRRKRKNTPRPRCSTPIVITASTKKRSFYGVPYHDRRLTEPCLAAAGREGGLQDGGYPEDLGCLLRFLQGGAEEIARPRRAQRLRPRAQRDDQRQRPQQRVQLFPDRLWRPGHRHQGRQIASRRSARCARRRSRR